MNSQRPTKKHIASQIKIGRWPHLPNSKPWKTNSVSFQQACHITRRLCESGMSLDEAISVVNKLYWSAYHELQKEMPIEPSHSRTIPYFNEFGLAMSFNAASLSLDELLRDYKFYGNVYAKSGKIWWTVSGGSAGGGPLHSFLQKVQLDNNYAFGPTKNQTGWPAHKLSELEAIGVYKRRYDAKVSSGQKKRELR
jgi:hypothetical protein